MGKGRRVSWMTEDGDHEGWAARLLPDGRISAGSTGRRGPDGTVTFYELVETSDDLVPSADVSGWRGHCACGWVGEQVWQRVSDPALADAAAGRVYVAIGDIADAPTEVEDAIHADWRTHVGPHLALAAVTTAARQVTAGQQQLDQAVRQARSAGASWGLIGIAAGMSRQSAHERWGRS